MTGLRALTLDFKTFKPDPTSSVPTSLQLHAWKVEQLRQAGFAITFEDGQPPRWTIPTQVERHSNGTTVSYFQDLDNAPEQSPSDGRAVGELLETVCRKHER